MDQDMFLCSQSAPFSKISVGTECSDARALLDVVILPSPQPKMPLGVVMA